MIHQIKIVFFFLFFQCFPAMAQLSFRIDSLVCFCYGEYDYYADNTWESKELLRRGPDILIHGTMTNESDDPIILEIIEYSEDTLIIHKELSLSVSYHYKKDYSFAHDPWVVSDYMSFPYWGEMVLPKKTITHHKESLSYTIIRAGESIPLAFETLAIPSSAVDPAKCLDQINTRDKKKAFRYQKRSSKAIKSSIKVIPVVHDYGDSDTMSNLLLEYESQQPEDESQFDFESSIPQYFLDKRPYYKEGGEIGFIRWFKEELEKDKSQISGDGYRLMICFIVSKEGDVIYSKVESLIPDQDHGIMKHMISSILLNSPKWEPGELHGKEIDSRITLFLSIGKDGNVDAISDSPSAIVVRTENE